MTKVNAIKILKKYLMFLKFEEITGGDMARNFTALDLKENTTIMNHITLKEIEIITLVFQDSDISYFYPSL
jgi:hypothetical protein